jgi:hypothetical protein
MLFRFALRRDETGDSGATHGGLIKGLTDFATIAD